MLNEPDLSALVRNLRGNLNITQEKLAQRLGVSFATVNRWENGKAKPSQLAQKQIEEMLKDLGPRGSDLLKEFFSNGL